MRKTLVLIICSITFFCHVSAAKSASHQENTVSTSVINNIVLAIQDEIYHEGFEEKFADIGEPVNGSEHNVPVYIQPTFTDGRGWIIYKLMPYGEIYRMYYIRNGLVILHGDPENGFPPTQPDYLTVYMNDGDLCKLKQQWIKRHFVINLMPSKKRIHEANARQKIRKSDSN
jgi:hypothetical protein